MAARIIWSLDAADDLSQIVEHIGRDSPRYGRQVAIDVMDAIDRAAAHPGSGRQLHERDDPTLRETRAYNYRII